MQYRNLLLALTTPSALLADLLIKEDEFEIEAGPEHEDAGVHLDFRDGARGQRLGHGHEADVLISGFETSGKITADAVVLDLEVAATVDHLEHEPMLVQRLTPVMAQWSTQLLLNLMIIGSSPTGFNI